MSQESFEQGKDLESELDELRTLQERRELLQRRWSELFDKRSGRSFLTPEDKEERDTLQEEMKSVEAERDELDREILKKRFDLGLEYLTQINRREGVIWQQIREHNPDPKNPLDTLYSKQWRSRVGDNIVEVGMTGETGQSFFAGMKHFAEKIGDAKVLEALKKWPKERKLDFNEVHLSFTISPKSVSEREKEALAPGLNMTKRFDHYDEGRDSVEIHLTFSHGAYAFPKIGSEEQETAKTEMTELAKKLGIKYF